MKDRIVEFPNRYKLELVGGTLDTYDLSPIMGEVIEAGDDINKVNLLPDTVATALGLTGNPQVKDALEKLSKSTMTSNEHPISSVAAGTEFTLNETIGGTTSPATFVKLKTDYEGSGRVLVARKEPITDIQWNSVTSSSYSGSTLDIYLNSTYIGYLDAKIQDVLENISIPYTIGSGNSTLSTILRKCFALSLAEYGLSHADANAEGSINYASILKIAYNGASAAEHWTRTPHKSATNYAYSITSAGEPYPKPVGVSDIMARPAFTLPSDFKIAIPTMNSLTDVLGNDFPLPYAKIVTGSYTGTGTFGVSNPTTIPIDSDTVMVIVFGSDAGAVMFTPLIPSSYTTRSYLTYSGQLGIASTSHYIKLDSNVISFYGANAFGQCNTTDVTYTYYLLKK